MSSWILVSLFSTRPCAPGAGGLLWPVLSNRSYPPFPRTRNGEYTCRVRFHRGTVVFLQLLDPLRGALAGCALATAALGADLRIYVLDVGQGSSAVVVGPTGTRVLIDGGNSGDGSGIVVPYLQSQGILGLDYSIDTHWHTDHMGGMDEVFNTPGFKPQVAAYDRGNSSIPSNTQVTQYLNSVAFPPGLRQTPGLGA